MISSTLRAAGGCWGRAGVIVPILRMKECPREAKELLGGGLSHIYSRGRKEDLHFLFSRLASSSESIGPVARYTHLPNSSYLPTSQKVKVRGNKKKKHPKKRKTAQRPIGV